MSAATAEVPWTSFTSWADAFAWDAATPRSTGIGPAWVGDHCTEGCRPSNHTESCAWYAEPDGGACDTPDDCEQEHRTTPREATL